MKSTAEHDHTGHTEKKSRDSEELFSLDFKSFTSSLKHHSRWLIPLLCILIAMSISIYFRTMPLRLPITEDWATNNVHNYFQSQLEQQIAQQYPNLPDQNRKALVDQEWQKFLATNGANVDATIKQVSQQYKDQFRDDSGVPYLLGIDPYHYYRQTALVVQNNFPGTVIKPNGEYWDMYRLAPIGQQSDSNLHHWFAAYLYKLINLFTDVPLIVTFFFVGTIFSALAIIPAFFIGRILTKSNVGGFFTAFLVAVSAFFVARTTGESSDTDVYTVFFALLVVWLFLQSLESEKRRNQLLWMAAAGISTGLFAFAWTGWWYITGFLIATYLFSVLWEMFQHREHIKTSLKTYIQNSFLASGLYPFLLYLATSIFTVVYFTHWSEVRKLIKGPFSFINLKAVGVYDLWPNIKTTVAELNVVSIKNVVEQLGGQFLFVLAILGIVLVLIWRRKKDGSLDPKIAFLMAIWLAASLYGTTKGMRFILQATPIFAISVGSFMGLAWVKSSEWSAQFLKLNKMVVGATIFILLSLLLVGPYNAGHQQAYQSVASMNDAWFNVLTKIKNEAPQNVILTSWWDFGHWFRAIADRPVTFDGGTQVGYGAYWVGKSLLSDNEKSTVGIVRMLNCGQNNAYEESHKIFNDTPREIDILNEIVVMDRKAAEIALSHYSLTKDQIEQVLQYTHCDAPIDYYITSEDMVGKAGVWGHFGSWDFKRAMMHRQVRELNNQEATQYLTSRFNLSPLNAETMYSEIISTDADKWISPWPGYLSSPSGCENDANITLQCAINTRDGNALLEVNLMTMDARFKTGADKFISPVSLVYTDKNSIQEKKYDSPNKTPFSVLLIQNNGKYRALLADPALASSTFTKLFFYNGFGMKCFHKFDDSSQFGGGKIMVWEMDYDCQQKNS